MPFEELEADWSEWQTLRHGQHDLRQAIFDRSPQLDQADYEENTCDGADTGVCVVCDCIMLPFH